ncbi:hypothetical protein Paes_0532 [Prosthecochloris aestuarii DSM 271]|uniref:Uncharacterized protein n=1 Tax=Prosthecochloris aestuarii (strain DSM 271 / SK 413) TaxID=290512 RepID=B4S5J1_PROA2|nr:hypothetical protein Paes_0532 [Prosthecochloris aestuarii DSM 271]
MYINFFNIFFSLAEGSDCTMLHPHGFLPELTVLLQLKCSQSTQITNLLNK